MKLSTKGRYAVIAMIELALHNKKGLLPLADLSLSQDISISYLEQLFARLRSADLVNGVRGPRGGYRLTRQPQDISIAEIVKAVDHKGAASPELPGNENDMRYTTASLWLSLSDKIHDFLDGISLSDAITEQQTMSGAKNKGIISANVNVPP